MFIKQRFVSRFFINFILNLSDYQKIKNDILQQISFHYWNMYDILKVIGEYAIDTRKDNETV